MLLRYPPLRLVTASVATKADQMAIRIRRGYWIQRARKRKGLTLLYVANALGYSGKSESIPSRWESGDRPVPSDKLEPLARLLSLPPHYLVRPPLTDDERLDAAVLAVSEQESEDSESGAEDDPQADDELDDELGRQSA